MSKELSEEVFKCLPREFHEYLTNQQVLHVLWQVKPLALDTLE